MKKLLILVPVLLLVFAGCDILNPAIVDHYDTVVGPMTGSIYDRDVTQADLGSGFIFYDDGGVDTTMDGTGEVLDMYYDNSGGDYVLTLVSPDDEGYTVPADKTPKETKFAAASDIVEADIGSAGTVITAPSMTAGKIAVEEDGWYWIKLDNSTDVPSDRDTEYVLLHVLSISADENQIDFEFWNQTDGTAYFGEEQE
ncbi:MAG: hypothetical protein SVK54_03990 [candidate division WOR-3 bacterium]|nr:hypothetical protein [candidate division WOR-3 bacterium]